MAEGEPFQSHLISMSAFGRRNFDLGVLYNYCSDSISSDQLSWSPSMLAAATRVDYETYEERYLTNNTNEFTNDNKAGSVVDLDNHMQMSVMAGLIDSNKGACNRYMNDKPDPEQVTCTLICRLISGEEKLDLQSLVNYKVPQLVIDDSLAEETDATHVVTSIFYGAETYCVLARDVGDEADEEIRIEIAENLAKLADKWALHHEEYVDDFKERLSREEKHFIAGVRCRLYSDLETQPVIHCGFFTAYLRIWEGRHEIISVPKEVCKRNSFPIVVQLCPLKIILGTTKGLDKANANYCDIDVEVVADCSRLFTGLKRAIIRAEKMSSANKKSALRDSLDTFVDLVTKYQNWAKTKLKKNIIGARQNNYSADRYLNCAVSDTERNTTLFKPTRLEKWLSWKQRELILMLSVEHEARNEVVFLADRSRLQKQLTSDTKKKYSVVLHVPPLDIKTSHELDLMKRYVTRIKNSFACFVRTDENRDNGEPWHFDLNKWDIAINKVRHLANHVERNKKISDQVHFIICFGGSSEPFDCRYSVYESRFESIYGTPFHHYQTVNAIVGRLPEPPTGLRISLPPSNHSAKRARTSCSLVHVEWDHRDVGYPCHYLVEYRVKGSFHPWIQQRTIHPGQDELSISVENGSSTEIRIAVETCIGRSEFSHALDTLSLFENGNTANDLEAGFDFLEQCDKIGHENGLDLYAIPLTKLNGIDSAVVRLVYGQPRIVDAKSTQKPRSILLIGQSDPDKLAVINAIVNYVFNVDYEGPFRFQLIKEKATSIVVEEEEEEGESEENKGHPTIFVYDLNYADGFRIPFSLTIIDVPSYVDDDSDKNMEISQSICHFFSPNSNLIQEVDMVGFIMDSSSSQLTHLQRFIHCSLMTVFGSKIKENLNLIFNCSDGQEPPLLTRAFSDAGLVTGQPLHHKLNSSAVFNSNIDPDNREDFQSCMENLMEFFSSLATTTSKSMPVDKQGHLELKRLEATVMELKKLVKWNMFIFKEMRNTKRNLDWNNVTEFETIMIRKEQQFRAVGEYVTNCTVCWMTCHEGCGNKEEKFECYVMDHSVPVASRTCRVCKCPWYDHQNDSTSWEYVQVKQTITTATVHANYENKLRKTLTAEEVVKGLEKDIALKKRVVVEQVEAILRYIKRSLKIGQHVTLSSKSRISKVGEKVIFALDELIAAEGEDRSDGFAERQDLLKKFRYVAVMSQTSTEQEICRVLERVVGADNLRPFDVPSEEEMSMEDVPSEEEMSMEDRQNV